MSYTPTEWNTGDVVTAEKLNKLENGVASSGGGILITVVNENFVLDKTARELKSAVESGITVYAEKNGTCGVLVGFKFMEDDPEYPYYYFYFGTNGDYYVSGSLDGYPADQG